MFYQNLSYLPIQCLLANQKILTLLIVELTLPTKIMNKFLANPQGNSKATSSKATAEGTYSSSPALFMKLHPTL